MLKINKILFPTDFSTCSKQAFPHALLLAEKYSSELHVLHVITINKDDPYNPAYDFPHLKEYNIHLEKYADERSDKFIKKHRVKTARIKKNQVRGYFPPRNILEYSKRYNIDLIVMGTHGRRGLANLFLGSVTEEVIRIAQCPVYIIRAQKVARQIEKINKILIPVDFSEHSKKALTYSKHFCNDIDVELDILHVVENRFYPAFNDADKSYSFYSRPIFKEKSLNIILEFLKNTPGPNVPAKINITEGFAAREILKFAEKNHSDMIVLNTHGISELNHFLLGSVAKIIVRRSKCPVLIVKSFRKQ